MRQRYDVEGKAPEPFRPRATRVRGRGRCCCDRAVSAEVSAATGQVMLLERSGKPVSLSPPSSPAGRCTARATPATWALWATAGGCTTPRCRSSRGTQVAFCRRPCVDRTGLEGAYGWVVEDADPKGGPDGCLPGSRSAKLPRPRGRLVCRGRRAIRDKWSRAVRAIGHASGIAAT